MNTLVFICGMGCGAGLVSTLFLLILKSGKRATDAFWKVNHEESLAQLTRRNDLLERQNEILEKGIRQ